MDILADLLTRARARGALFSHSTLRAPWGLEFHDGQVALSVHAVLAGEMWVERAGNAPLRLLQGDLLLVNSKAPYAFVHAPGARVRPLGELLAPGPQAGTRRFSLGGGGLETGLVCGAYTFEGAICDSLLASLPEIMPLPSVVGSDPPLRTVLDLLTYELGREAPGQQTLLDRLLDLLLVYAMRAWFAQPGTDAPAWFRALDDPSVGAALRALHADPARAWTVAGLATAAGLSRAALARRFAALTGRPPLAYLTAWRMTLAREALLRPGATLAAVAQEVGYGSEFAFAAAFKRELGTAPGRWRDERLAAQPADEMTDRTDSRTGLTRSAT